MEASSEGFHGGVVAGGDERSDVERAAEIGTSTPDVASPTGETAIGGMRGKAGQAGDPAAVRLAQFGQACD